MIILVTGRRELGKTQLALFLARLRASRALFAPRGILRYDNRAGVVATDAREIESAFLRFRLGLDRELVVTPADDLQGDFDQLCELLRAYVEHEGRGHGLALVVDEASFVDIDAAPIGWLLRCVPRASVDIIITCHRPSDVSTGVRSIADQWVIFQTRQEHDLKVIAERCGAPVAALVAELPPFHFVQWDDAAGKYWMVSNSDAWGPKATAQLAPAQPLEPQRKRSAFDNPLE